MPTCASCFPEGTLDEESIIISALLHDICKADHYRWSHHQKRWVRQLHPWRHGYRSVQVLRDECHLRLEDVEQIAVRYHMHRDSHDHYAQLSEQESVLCQMLVKADQLSAAHGSKMVKWESFEYLLDETNDK